ncbi:PREDICTED: probable serine/threonine-protein kinase kinX isoform X2 [Papilio xuthus]|uniref:Probable serine/threonine-protein kinase kinX isoform X2 n=1 Tax=Papilio xuthus TaxID=66420 RepID=A0AAJ6Z686_PAPXU|nr:PREDICTED: probable serine/threonine-protein kinase kinX isoform X2 [Papilio xuthus]
MNPPSQLYGAMNKERKPFTYTPGGIDLSQIKSERMAQRLLRNAMDQGVPEQPTSHLQSPPTPTAINVPNFNCLPVQVFPTFPLPSNPKSLLKTRSNQQKEPCLQDIPNSEQLKTNVNQFGIKQCYENNNKNISNYNQLNNENKNNDQSSPLHEYTPPIVRSYPYYETSEYADASSPKCYVPTEIKSYEDDQYKYNDSINNKTSFTYEPSVTNTSDTTLRPLLTSTYTMEKNIPKTLEEMTGTENNQNEIKVVKKHIETENNTEGQNGDANVEAAVTVKLPGKKSSAKTETKVEVVKNVRPDGSTEEVKTTTTKTTIDGKTEITTKTETTIIPKEEEYEEEEFVEEEEEEEEENEQENAVIKETAASKEDVRENDVENDSEVDEDIKHEQKENLSSQEETSETIITKQVTVTQSEQNQENSEEEVEEEEEEKEEEVESKNEENQVENNITDNREESEEDADDEDEEKVDIKNEKIEEPEEKDRAQENQEPETKQHEELEESETIDVTKSKEVETQLEETIKTEDKKEKEVTKEDSKSSTDVTKETVANDLRDNEESEKSTVQSQDTKSTDDSKEEIIIEVQVLKPSSQETENTKIENEVKSSLSSERNIPFREPSAPLEKVEDVEIKPIGEIISKTRTENTEIITTSLDKPTTGLSTQTAYNRIENIVTVNKTTKTLDHAYDQHPPLGIPTVKTYFAPTTDRLTTSPYQPVYTPEPQTERRHSLLLDRLSVDRQIPPAELYQSNYQTYEQNQWTQEPQSEVLTVSNVKPSTITKNQQWYQQTKKEEVSYDTAPSLNAPTQDWSTQPQQRQTPQPSQTQFQYQPQTQPSYTIDKQDTFTSTLNNSNIYQQTTYQPSYVPKPTSWVGNNVNLPKTIPTINKPQSQYSYVNKEPTETYQTLPQPYSSSYIPPPWEQDPNYVPESLNTPYYTPPPSNKFTSSTTPAWTPKPTSKFSKPKPTSYIPPAPNQSFVKPVTMADQPKLPGRKTYYSEYERRYISVPEATYIPTENKFQAQPDPSPQYYYDNNEPKETVEHEWRKELREFSEKTQSQTNTDQTSVRPPWEEDPKYYAPTVTTEFTSTPTWSQTLRPSSWRDRSFESEFGRAKELSRANTLGRGRPQSSYVKSNISTPIQERTRGVSVDRYNPNNYQSPVPSEYPPVQSHTLDPSVGAKTYHNPNVPAYHSRASAEPREQSAAIPQPRHYAEARAPPLQSRSFKYLQWITGTED